MNIPPAGTIVSARQYEWDAIQANNLLEYPDPRLPTLEGAPEWVTGPLVIEHVTTRWGSYTRYKVGRWSVDPTTISPLN